MAAVADTVGQNARYYDFWHCDSKYSPESMAECLSQVCTKENIKPGDTLWVITDGDPKNIQNASVGKPNASFGEAA